MLPADQRSVVERKPLGDLPDESRPSLDHCALPTSLGVDTLWYVSVDPAGPGRAWISQYMRTWLATSTPYRRSRERALRPPIVARNTSFSRTLSSPCPSYRSESGSRAPGPLPFAAGAVLSSFLVSPRPACPLPNPLQARARPSKGCQGLPGTSSQRLKIKSAQICIYCTLKSFLKCLLGCQVLYQPQNLWQALHVRTSAGTRFRTTFCTRDSVSCKITCQCLQLPTPKTHTFSVWASACARIYLIYLAYIV